MAEKGGENIVLEEFVEGDTLDFLLRDALFSPEETRKIVMQLCRALWSLHDLGAVHRDVKPDNVILRGNEAVLIDFDAACVYKADQAAATNPSPRRIRTRRRRWTTASPAAVHQPQGQRCRRLRCVFAEGGERHR